MESVTEDDAAGVALADDGEDIAAAIGFWGARSASWGRGAPAAIGRDHEEPDEGGNEELEAHEQKQSAS